MSVSREKIQKLTDIARLYYEQDQTQGQIAAQYGISRPLVSRMLKEAKELGIVNVRISAPLENGGLVLNQAKNIFGIRGGLLVPVASSDNATDQTIAAGVLEYLASFRGRRLGLGWGTMIGAVACALETRSPAQVNWRSVCPLVGNSGVSNRDYHSNEHVRIFAQQFSAYPQYLYAPAFVETPQEQELIRKLESYRVVRSDWERLDVALVNIGNYPSVPDFASVARYGDLLMQKKAAGQLLAYYFDEQGEILRSDTDYTIQIPTQLLGQCKNVIGICSSSVNPRALVGALRTGLIHHVVATEALLLAAAEYRGSK